MTIRADGKCPDVDTLAAHARRELAEADAAAVDRHLHTCRPCLDRYVELGVESQDRRIPYCHVVKELGRGRFGTVYRAWWLRDRPRLVALKILNNPGEMEKSRFEREIAVLKRIDSPWIVKCLDSGTTGDALYYVMELVEGEHFDSYLAGHELTIHDKLAVFARVCRAVAYAHDQGVIHRDLKPKNILITLDGEPHLLDFGICGFDQTGWSSLAHGDITHPGDVVGTLKYMSPEQAWGGVAGPIDHRSDIWSLGVMLHEVVTGGGHPYSLAATRDKPAPEALIERIRKELPNLPRLDAIPNGRSLEVLLSRCLAWEPGQRLASAAILADDLERFCRNEPIRTKPLGVRYRLRRLAVGAAARSRVAFAAVFVALLFVTLVLATYAFNVGWHVSGAARGTAPEQQHGAGTEDARDAILVVAVDDDTAATMLAVAEANGIPDVTTNNLTWRPIHGLFMRRLAAAEPEALVWDFYFTTPQPHDAKLVAGIEALEAQGIPVTLAARSYDVAGSPLLSPAIVGGLGHRLRHGAISARKMTERPGEFVLASRSGGGDVVPSLALMTLGSILHPEAVPDVEWPSRTSWIELHYAVEPGRYLRDRDRLDFTKAYPAPRDEAAFRAEDLLACSSFRLDPPEEWERRTIPYQRLLSASDEELVHLVSGKIIIVGDLRRGGFGVPTDRHPVSYGDVIVQDVPGVFLLADAIAGLMDQRYLRLAFPFSPAMYVMLLAAAILACLLPIKIVDSGILDRPGSRRVLWLTVACLSAASLAVMLLAKHYITVHAGMISLSFFAPMFGSFWVELTRNRHRMLDRDRRTILGFGAGHHGTAVRLGRAAAGKSRTAADGTVTLEQKRPKSPP